MTTSIRAPPPPGSQRPVEHSDRNSPPARRHRRTAPGARRQVARARKGCRRVWRALPRSVPPGCPPGRHGLGRGWPGRSGTATRRPGARRPPPPRHGEVRSMAGVFSSVHDVTTGGLGAAVQTVLRSAGGSASMAVLIQPRLAVDVGGAGQDPCSPARYARSAPITSPRSPRAQVATVTGCPAAARVASRDGPSCCQDTAAPSRSVPLPFVDWSNRQSPIGICVPVTRAARTPPGTARRPTGRTRCTPRSPARAWRRSRDTTRRHEA